MNRSFFYLFYLNAVAAGSAADLNSLLRKKVTAWTTAQSRVVLVDQFSGFNLQDDTEDGMHPNRAGDEKMASRWADALMRVGFRHSHVAIRIMPFGDSITEWNYRFDLWQKLRDDANFMFYFTGRKESFPRLTGYYEAFSDAQVRQFSSQHEGHAGKRTDELIPIAREAGKANMADVVLLHVGTNDLLQAHSSLESVAANIYTIIETLRSSNPKVIILVAQIIPFEIRGLDIWWWMVSLTFGACVACLCLLGACHLWTKTTKQL